METLRRQLWPGLACTLLATGIGAAAWSSQELSDPFPHQASAYLVMIEGKTAWARHQQQRLPPASLTKIMTALLVLERNRPDDLAVASPEAAGETGSRLGLKAGETMTVKDLLAAMLLMSANDACHVLADHVAGSEAQFVDRMNSRARAMGLNQTSFKNACGHDRDGHLSSAQDLAVLAQAAMSDPTFAALAANVRVTVSTTDSGRTFQLENKNELVGRYPGVIGVKSGFTAKAGKCVVALAQREGRRVLLVLLNAPDRWWTASAMLDQAFSAATPPWFGAGPS